MKDMCADKKGSKGSGGGSKTGKKILGRKK